MDSKGYEVLAWDSSFFGYKVARVADQPVNEGSLKRIISEMDSEGVRLAYLTASDKTSSDAGKKLGGYLACQRATYVGSLPPIPKAGRTRKTEVEEYSESVPDPGLEALALQAGEYSRFRTDPKIGDEQFRRLYLQWIRNSTNKSFADAVLVTREKNAIAGFVTTKISDGRGSIGLIAVAANERGKDLGSVLLEAAGKWLHMKGCDKAYVATQRSNEAACRLYERCGYRLDKIEDVYHIWLR